MGPWIDLLVYRYDPNLTPLISLRVGLFLLKLSINLKCPTPTQTMKESPTNHPRVVTKIDTPTLLSTYTSYPYVYIYVHTLQQIIYKCAWFSKRKRQRKICVATCHGHFSIPTPQTLSSSSSSLQLWGCLFCSRDPDSHHRAQFTPTLICMQRSLSFYTLLSAYSQMVHHPAGN